MLSRSFEFMDRLQAFEAEAFSSPDPQAQEGIQEEAATQEEAQFSLDAVLGVELGMSLGEAMDVLAAQGYQPVPFPPGHRADVAEDPMGQWRVIQETGPLPGTLVSRATLRTPEGPREALVMVLAQMIRPGAGAQDVAMLFSGEPSEVTGDPGQSQVWYAAAMQQFSLAAPPVAPQTAKDDLRETVAIAPTCDFEGTSQLLTPGVVPPFGTLAWFIKEDGSVVPAMAPAECRSALQGTVTEINIPHLMAAALGNEPLAGRFGAVPEAKVLTAEVLARTGAVTMTNQGLLDMNSARQSVVNAIQAAMAEE